MKRKRIVIKVGSNVLTRADGKLDVTRMSSLVDQIAWLRKQEIEVNRFDEEELGVKYTFDDIVPLGISNGKGKMDFRKIKTRI